MKTGTSMQIRRVAPIRHSLLAAQVPEPLKRKEWTEVQLKAGYAKWLEHHRYTCAQIAAVLGLEYRYVYQVLGLVMHRRVPEIKPPQEVLDALAEKAAA